MKAGMIDAVEESVFSGVLDNLENEAEYMENINDEEEYANGMRYVIDVLREWYVRKNFVDVDFSRRNAEFRGNLG
jgi:hypothetical protein